MFVNPDHNLLESVWDETTWDIAAEMISHFSRGPTTRPNKRGQTMKLLTTRGSSARRWASISPDWKHWQAGGVGIYRACGLSGLWHHGICCAGSWTAHTCKRRRRCGRI